MKHKSEVCFGSQKIATQPFWVTQARNITVLSRDVRNIYVVGRTNSQLNLLSRVVSNKSVLGRAKSPIISWVAQSRNIPFLGRTKSRKHFGRTKLQHTHFDSQRSQNTRFGSQW